MYRKFLAIVLCSAGTAAFGEAQRALFTHENKFPELRHFEAGAYGQYFEVEDGDYRNIGPYVRYGLIENLTINAFVPYAMTDTDVGEDESGLGDAVIGLELKAYEDIFEYPYVIPHVEVSLETGDEDDGLGRGESVTTVGVSVGTVTYDVLHWVLDFSYAANGGRQRPDPENIFILAGSLVWDVSPRFALILEGYITDDEHDDDENDDTPWVYQGGFAYKWTERFATSFHFGASNGVEEDGEGLGAFKASYTF